MESNRSRYQKVKNHLDSRCGSLEFNQGDGDEYSRRYYDLLWWINLTLGLRCAVRCLFCVAIMMASDSLLS